jgi:nicotinamide-nucleotide amidase
MPSPFDTELIAKARRIIEICVARGIMIATAESCTGGLVAGLLTEISGSSAVVDRGFVTYSNEAKQDMLAVPAEMLDTVGAVSKAVAIAMAEGALKHSRATITVSITGIAGPTGGSADKPVGLVHFGCAKSGEPTRHVEHHFGNLGRTEVRRAAMNCALDLILQRL